MNEICAHIKPTSKYNMSILLVGKIHARLRRALDLDDDWLNNNSSDLIDDQDYELPTSTISPAAAPIPKDYDDTDFANTELMEKLKNTTDMIRTYLSENYEDFRHSSETNVMIPLASLGLILNFLSLLAIVLDRRTAVASRRVHGSYVVAQQVFLAFIVYFLGHKKVTKHERYGDLEAMNYFTVCLGLVQFLQPWMLFAVAGYVRACLEKLFGMGEGPKFPVTLVNTSLFFAGSLFSLYIPPVRIRLSYAMTDYVLCEDPPVESLWNLNKIGDKSLDIISVLIYSISYIFALYLVPSALICYRTKGIVDLLHALEEQPKILANCQELACTALVVSVTCNLHLACVVLKVVVYLFYLIELFFSFVDDTYVFFLYMSVIANLLIIVGSGCHVFILMRYNQTVKYFLLRVAYRMKWKILWLRDSLPRFWKKASPTESDLAEADSSSSHA